MSDLPKKLRWAALHMQTLDLEHAKAVLEAAHKLEELESRTPEAMEREMEEQTSGESMGESSVGHPINDDLNSVAEYFDMINAVDSARLIRGAIERIKWLEHEIARLILEGPVDQVNME